jgi:hypothetical protein
MPAGKKIKTRFIFAGEVLNSFPISISIGPTEREAIGTRNNVRKFGTCKMYSLMEFNIFVLLFGLIMIEKY